jgi:phage terminase large subunit-like protein
VGCERSEHSTVERQDDGIEPSPSLTHPQPLPNREGSQFIQTLIAVDPPSGDGTCGIIACARDADDIAHILADHSVTARSPEGWANAVSDAATIHGQSGVPALVVAEANQGGRMVQSILHTANPNLRVKLVTAAKGKTIRAEPVVHLFEAGRVVLHGRHPELESELLGMIAGGGYEGPGRSPDRADAMVWGVTELMLGGRRR